MTYQQLLDWFEDRGISSIDEDFDEFEEVDIQEALLEFGISKSSQSRDVAESQLAPVLSRISDDLFSLAKESRGVSRSIANLKDLNTIEKVIGKDVQPALAERIGIERSKEILKRDVFSTEADRAISFLRQYSPQTLGGLRRQEIRRAGSLQALNL